MSNADRTALALMLLMTLAMCATQRRVVVPECGICPRGTARECFCVELGRPEMPEPDEDAEALAGMLTPGDALEACMDMWPEQNEPITTGVR
jgi:hypothetical protein